jgi:hypothetical protein
MNLLNLTIKKYFYIFTFLLSVTVFTSCNTTVNINDYIDKNATFTLTARKTDTITGLSTSDSFVVAVNSDKYKNIIQWGNENTNGWQTTFASYIADISLTQNNFRLLLTGNNGVVIGFTDKDGKPRQYSKTINKNELNFLTK